jgi:hypothetical protein
LIRPVKATETNKIAEMLREMHAASKYATRMKLSDKTINAMLLGLVAGQGQSGPQGSLLIAAVQDGKFVGFMAGVLDRVYHIGDKLIAGDAYLYVRPGNKVEHVLGLIDAYIAWAQANPKVIEIKLTWSDALPGAEGLSKVYARKGFDLTGEIFEMRLDAEKAEAA